MCRNPRLDRNTTVHILIDRHVLAHFAFRQLFALVERRCRVAKNPRRTTNAIVATHATHPDPAPWEPQPA